MTIRELRTQDEWLEAYSVLKELRPHLTADSLKAAHLQQPQEGYRLCCVVEKDQVAACIGWRIQTHLSSGKTLYVDDLITAASHRRKGFGRALLGHAFAAAQAAGCQTFSLDSGHQRYDAHRVYLNFGMKIRSHHFDREVV